MATKKSSKKKAKPAGKTKGTAKKGQTKKAGGKSLNAMSVRGDVGSACW